LLMVPRDEEGEKIARKRSKQRGPKPFVLPTGFGTRAGFQTGNVSPPPSPDDDWQEDQFGEGRDSPSDLSNEGGESTRMDPVDPASETSDLEKAAEELFGSEINFVLPAARPPEVRPEPRPEKESRAEAWRSLSADDSLAMMPPLPWNNILLLQEEFVHMNDHHRRESSHPISAF